jgi:hypothetical protein
MEPLPNYDTWLTHDREAELDEIAAQTPPAGVALPGEEVSPPAPLTELGSGLDVSLTPAESTIQNLLRWKVEAILVLRKWEEVASAIEAIDPCPLGRSRGEHALRYIERTRDE